ncbi:MAG: hypothetical protein CL609_17770 [Anaerolineaceae bacterium]|nr:hypothetical protein [Anaerolineaceae bacterium]
MDIQLTVWVFIMVGLAAFLTGFSKAGFGGMMGPMITILVSLVIPIDKALGILLPILMVGDWFALATYWRKWDNRSLLILLPGAIVTVIIGSYFLSNLSSFWIKRIMAGVILIFVILKFWQSWRKQVSDKPAKPIWGVLGGSIAGFTSAIAHSGSPPITMFLITRGLSPETLAATMAVSFATLNMIKLPSYILSGVLNFANVVPFLWLFLLVPVGVFIGRKVTRYVKKEKFEKILLVLLAMTAVLLLFD